MKREKAGSRKVITPLVGSIAALLLCGNALVQGQSATWSPALMSTDWNTAANWNPNTVPNSSSAVATFATSNTVNITISQYTQVGGIVFNPSASGFTIGTGANELDIDGAGVTNNSGVVQNFQVSNFGDIFLYNKATAGTNTAYTVAGSMFFFDTSSAGAATLIANGGVIYFFDSSTGGTPAVKLYNNGVLDISNNEVGGVAIGSLEGTGVVNLGNNNLTVGTNNATTVFSGVIQDGGEGGGGGSLTKVGTGTLSLNGANTYTGSTTVNGGTLLVNGSIISPQTFVNPGGILGGTGMIGGAVFNSGIVQPGDAPGTLTITGNYNQAPAGALLIRIGGLGVTQHDLLAVGGVAALAGTLQLEDLNSFRFSLAGQKVTFLTAAGGVTGAFTTVHNPFSTGTMIGTEIVYAPNSVSIEAVQESFSALVKAFPFGVPYETQNQAAVAYALDSSLLDPRNAALISHLDHESFGDVLGDLDRIAPDELTSIYQIAFSQAKIQTANLERRLEDIRSGATGFSAAGFAMNGSSQGYSGPLGDGGSLEAQGPDGKSDKLTLAPTPDNRWGVFVTGTGDWTSVGDTSNSHGYDLIDAGFTLGVDYKVTDHFVIGLATGYDYSSADLVSGGRVFVNGGKLGLYSSYFTGTGFYTDLGVQGGYNSYDTHRAALEGFADGKTEGGELNLFFSTGYEWKKGGLTFGPTADFGYTYLGLGNFDERGSLAPLDLPDQHQESIRSIYGAKVSYDWKLGNIVVKPEMRAGWQHEFGDATLGFESRFEDGASPEFLVHGPATGRDSLVLSAGFAIRLSERVSTYVYYDGELARTNYQDDAVSGGFRVSF